MSYGQLKVKTSFNMTLSNKWNFRTNEWYCKFM